jgi:Fe-S oxidoreductase
LGVRKIIVYSPHAYNAVKNYYQQYGGNFEVFHYTQILWDFMKSENTDPSNGLRTKVAFHDPCFLGRWNNEYEAPRDLLRVIKGVELIEMDKNREGALCCGGGAGNFSIDLLGGSETSPARRRVREALNAGANILAVTCPKCLVMLDDAVKSEGLEDKLLVMDISEIVANTCEMS